MRVDHPAGFICARCRARYVSIAIPGPNACPPDWERITYSRPVLSDIGLGEYRHPRRRPDKVCAQHRPAQLFLAASLRVQPCALEGVLPNADDASRGPPHMLPFPVELTAPEKAQASNSSLAT
jgi:hypothetical protein